MTDEQLTARGVSIPIYRAIEKAGGAVAVANHFGLKTAQMPAYHWPRKRNIPAHYIVPLCDLGGRGVQPEEILADITLHGGTGAA